ncbi:MAG: hypothetical protein [Microviridae sp.]|nr:MAG: hypothetical protein [Microviridae sp.]
MMRSPDRKRAKRKYRLDRSSGPVVLIACFVQKKLIHHSWSCALEYELTRDEEMDYNFPYIVRFVPLPGAPFFGPDWYDAFALAVRLVSDANPKVVISVDKNLLWLVGSYDINRYGRVIPAPSVPF